MAAYVLTDWPVMQALTRAADRGVAIHLSNRRPSPTSSDISGCGELYRS